MSTRREFISLLGGAAAAWPLAAGAQQTAKLPTIGVLGSATPSTQAPRFAAFVQRLRELGWIENRTVAIEYRWAEWRDERFAEIAAEFVRLKVDVIVTSGTPAVMALKQATAAIPIVFVALADPLGGGIVASLARPGGNATGLSLQAPDIAGKRLALLREVVPNLRRVAFMGNVDNPIVPPEMREVQAAASMFGLEVATFPVRRTQDIVPAFEELKHRTEAIYLANEGVVDANRLRINILALGARLPTMWSNQETAEAGGLMSYGPSFPDQWRRAGDFVDKILRGAKPADLPVEQPVKFDLVVNLVVAKALGIEISPTLLARADEVIE
jgi:putative tryptophan/tyrosine transport system substrate-binding protein